MNQYWVATFAKKEGSPLCTIERSVDVVVFQYLTERQRRRLTDDQMTGYYWEWGDHADFSRETRRQAWIDRENSQ